MRMEILQTKRTVRTYGEVQLPIKVGEEVCYYQGGHLMWTDKVQKILEVAEDYIQVETSSYYYIIDRNHREYGQLKMAA